jgi:hypothetical protein
MYCVSDVSCFSYFKYALLQNYIIKVDAEICAVKYLFSYSSVEELNNFGEISGSHSGEYEDDYLLGCCTL